LGLKGKPFPESKTNPETVQMHVHFLLADLKEKFHAKDFFILILKQDGQV
jgi:hypothetical protein